MSTYKEICYIVKDLLKVASDDATFENEHVAFLADKFRAMLLKKYYSSPRKRIPDANYQRVCLALETYNSSNCDGQVVMRSRVTVPRMLGIGSIVVSPKDFSVSSTFSYIPYERFSYVNTSGIYSSVIYTTIGPDGYLYIKGSGSSFLQTVAVSAIFQDALKAGELLCDCSCSSSSDSESCDTFDVEFPLEEALTPELIEYVVKDMANGLYKGADIYNNANDDLSDISKYIATYMKKDFVKDK